MAEALAKGWVDAIPPGRPLTDICWNVMEAVSRAALVAGLEDRPLGPLLLEIDDAGAVLGEPPVANGFIVDGHGIRIGGSLLPLLAPDDRGEFLQLLADRRIGEARFCPLRLHRNGTTHTVCVGVRRQSSGRIALLVQPLIPGGPVVGRHINSRDPITGLLTRWAMSRVFEMQGTNAAAAYAASVMVLRLDNLSPISDYIGGPATDDLMVHVASLLVGIVPHPAVCSRTMGNTFVVFLPDRTSNETLALAREVIEAVNGIGLPGFEHGFKLTAAAGVADVVRGDFDLAVRSATAAAANAGAGGSNRALVAGPAFTHGQISELSTKLEIGDWEVWLQPVSNAGAGDAARLSFHESLARFTNGHGHLISRPDFFASGRVHGLLEVFDRMMLRRVVQLLATHPSAKISVNLSLETFVSEAFPQSILDIIGEATDCCGRIILEIGPHCLMGPMKSVMPRLEALAAAGIAVALDDFGSGICRLNVLTRFPLAIVKLDELVTGYIADDPLQREFVRAVVSICRARGMTTVAEYTRGSEQIRRLLEDGVDLFQGELFGMPAPAADVLGPPVAGVSSA